MKQKEYSKGCVVIESSNLIETTKDILKEIKVKELIFDPFDFSYATFLNFEK